MKLKNEKQYVKYVDDGSTKRCSAVAVSLPLKKAELVFIRIVL